MSHANSNRRDNDLPPSEDVLSLSFLDVLSCGFGASMFLFVVFSIMPHIGSTTGTSGAGQARPASGAGALTLNTAALYAVIEVEIVASLPAGIKMANDPWGGSAAGADVIGPFVLPDKKSWDVTAEYETGAAFPQSLTFRLAKGSPPPAGEVSINGRLMIGGTSKPFQKTIPVAVAALGEDLLSIDIRKPEAEMIRWLK